MARRPLPGWSPAPDCRSPDHRCRVNLHAVTCPLCHKRPAKRACPALGRDICPTCCATKRLVEIRCPSDCRYLETSQKHPAATVRKQQEHDIAILLGAMGRRPTEMQLQLFFLISSVITRFRPEGLMTLGDSDVADAAAAMAGTLEAADRGVIAELPGNNPVSEGLRRRIDGFLAEIGKRGGPGFGRQAAEVLRGIERGARHEAPGLADDGPNPYLALLNRVMPPAAEEKTASPGSPIIIP